MFVYDKIFWTKAISQFNKLKLNGLPKIFHKNSELNKKLYKKISENSGHLTTMKAVSV